MKRKIVLLVMVTVFGLFLSLNRLTLNNIFLLDMVLGKIPPLMNQSEPIVWSSSNSVTYVFISFIQMATSVVGSWILLSFIVILVVFVLRMFLKEYSSAFVAVSATTLLVFNPFFYERFISGQWFVILGYLSSVLFINELLLLVSETEKKISLRKTLTMLFLVGCFSFHFLVIDSILFFVASIFIVFYSRFNQFKTTCKIYAKAILIFFFCSLYWVVPLAVSNTVRVKGMGIDHWEAYMTTVNPDWGWLISIFSLYGFWGERYPWSHQFFWIMESSSWAWYLSAAALALIILYGFARSVTLKKSRRTQYIFLFSIMLISAIFSLGISESPFNLLNKTFLEYVPFWGGFRDSQKWTGIVAICFVFAYAESANSLTNRYKMIWEKCLITLMLIMIPVAYTPMNLTNQLWTTDYPEGWYAVDYIISKHPSCKAVFLPWHQYYYLSFNRYRLTGNPSRNFFSCKIYSSLDSEHGQTGLPQYLSDEELAVHEIISSKIKYTPHAAIQEMRKYGFKYILLTEITEYGHEYENITNARDVTVIYKDRDIILLEI